MDEKEALGILRMLNAGGNDAAEFLQSLGWHLPEVIDFILEVVSLPRETAAQRIAIELDPKHVEEFLTRTHGENLPPSFILVHHSMIVDNMAMTRERTPCREI